MTAPTPTTRSRGRPRRAQSLASDVRQQLLDATAQAFIARGYHGLSVELILSGAGISRPTFYKYFRNTDEAIDQVLARLNQELIEGMSQAVDQAGDARSTLEAALNYWRQWGRDLGPMLGALHAELHDRHSPASRHRLATLAILQARLERR
jgi:TetR/AcrR family transcriptional regulator